MTLYIDVLFAINFSMDFLSLYLTAVGLRKKIYKLRIVFSAILGGIYGVLEFVLTFSPLFSSFLSVLISVLMCLIAYKDSGIIKFIFSLILFWGASASLGGIMSLLFNFLNQIFYRYLKEYSYSEVYSGARFFIIASLSVLIASVINKIIMNKKQIREADVEVQFKGETFQFKGLCDSGNLLKEPISGRDVILISSQSKLGKMIELEKDVYKRYIPYTVVNAEGVLKGVLPDVIIVNNNEVNAIVAPIENLNLNGLDAIIPTSLL